MRSTPATRDEPSPDRCDISPPTRSAHGGDMTRIALITGGNRGLGRSEALALAADGTDVVITYRSHANEAKAVVAEIEALGRTAVALQLDTAVPETFDAFADTLRTTLAQTWGRDGFDVLVNNAGFAAPTPLGGIDVATVRALLDTHVTGVVMLTRRLCRSSPTAAASSTPPPGWPASPATSASPSTPAPRAPSRCGRATSPRSSARAGSPSTPSRPAPPAPTSAAVRCATTSRCAPSSAEIGRA